ncbi:hypothetical protein A1D18_02430 [Candidatus Rickettsiella isopodorum]|jgi:hypothetical protein|uniref:Uncharacterized protein n=1 Tax=Candidatus Rickettsiella isopodorum TaxID=1225476 RepID=A0A1J8P5A2_9COXI|nr:hypothetical protein [Candidatus Rickettsiella isopodorum]OIZ94980.1 hypothetical protein A1D18_02430 [Candidatus Rickettsiella isopodorum]
MNNTINCLCNKKNFNYELTDKIMVSTHAKTNVTDLLNSLIERVKNISIVLENDLNTLLNLSETLPESKDSFLQTLNNTKFVMQHFLSMSSDDQKLIENERKRLEELLAHVNSTNLAEMKQSIHNAMNSDQWQNYRQYLFCNPPYGIWAYVLKIVVTENSYKFCDYLLTANQTIENNILKIYDLLNDLSNNKFIIKLRIEQIKKNWLVIIENVDLAKQQPNFFEDCYGLKLENNKLKSLLNIKKNTLFSLINDELF